MCVSPRSDEFTERVCILTWCWGEHNGGIIGAWGWVTYYHLREKEIQNVYFIAFTCLQDLLYFLKCETFNSQSLCQFSGFFRCVLWSGLWCTSLIREPIFVFQDMCIECCNFSIFVPLQDKVTTCSTFINITMIQVQYLYI